MAANYFYPQIPVDIDWFLAEVADQVERKIKLGYPEDFIFDNTKWDKNGNFEIDLIDPFSHETITTIYGGLQIDSNGRALVSKISY